MARNTFETAFEINQWKDRISTLDKIPMNLNHNYQDGSDIYERLTMYVKGWVESVFNKITDKDDGQLKSALGKYPESAEWMKTGVKLTELQGDWWTVALMGKKNGNPLPYFDESTVEVDQNDNKKNVDPDELRAKAIKDTKRDIRDAVEEQFFPAYRALEESFKKRWWIEWIFNHKQYTAERDALKVMRNLITSITGYTKDELKAKYEIYREFIKPRDVESATKEEYARVKELEADMLAHPEKYSSGPKEPENVVEEFNRLDNDQMAYGKLIEDMGRAVQGTELNENSLWRAIPDNVYAPMRDVAKNLCAEYKAMKENGTLEVDGELTANAKEAFEKAAKEMFEKAFTGLNTQNPKNGKTIFYMKDLASQIISAQKLTDVVLKQMTPIGFVPKKYTEYAKGNHFFEKMDQIRDFVKASTDGKYTDEEINAAIGEAKRELEIVYRGKRREMPQVYKVGYRPDTTRLEDERREIEHIHRLVSKNPQTGERQIPDEDLRVVINENYRRFKAVYKAVSSNTELNMETMDKTWIEMDKKIQEKYPEYNAENAQALVRAKDEAKEAAKNAQKINVDLKEPKANLVPPVQVDSVQIRAPKLDK